MKQQNYNTFTRQVPNIDTGFWFEVRGFGSEKGFLSFGVYLPNLIVEPIVVIIVELLVFGNPVSELFELEGACFGVNLIISEDSSGESFY